MRPIPSLLVAMMLLAGPVAAAAAEHVPTHVLTWYYYGLNNVNDQVSARTMAERADFVEDDGYSAAHAQAYKEAGGRFAGAYTDPAYVPYCFPPFTPPAKACGGPIGSIAPESAWFHGRDGSRVRKRIDEHFGFAEALNPAAPAAREAYRRTTDGILAKAPSLDFFFADDYGGPWRSGDGSPKDAWFYGYNDVGVEIGDDASFIRAAVGMLSSAARPVFVNGADPVTGKPAYGGAYLMAPRVLGATHESCFRGGDGVQTDAKNAWASESDSVLSNTLLRRYAVCFMTGTPSPANRLYALASWWITYDAQYSVAAPIDPVPHASAILPEYDLVPREPLQTAARSVQELRAAGGVYAREFGLCYQAGKPIGGCAAVVNPTAHAAALPTLRARYASVLALDARDALTGGAATWHRGVPDQLGAATALVLRR